MVSAPGDRTEAKAGQTGQQPFSSQQRNEILSQMDTELIFRLIDSILPFEACLYHQVLPLTLEGSRVRLGMVNLDDTAALDYVRRIMAFMNCSLVPQPLASEVHHAVLSAYLNYTQQKKSSPKPIARLAERNPTPRANPSPPPAVNTEKPDPNLQATLLVDSPEQLTQTELKGHFGQETPVVKGAASIPEAPVEEPNHPSQVDSQTPLQSTPLAPEPPAAGSSPRPSTDGLPELELFAEHLSSPPEVLASLPPATLLQELLARVLVDGIGRLYFERQAQHGRILWSQNGVPQSVLENLPLPVLQSVINELKLLTHLPLMTVQKPRQVEIERIYQQQRLLLRLRVMPGSHGEEATLQVLRGAALKFYQQQQLANLSRDALSIAQDLQNKVNEIRSRTRFNAMLTAEQLSVLPALDQVLRNVEQQLADLKLMATAQSDEATQPSPYSKP